MVTKVSGINIKNADKKKKKFNLDFSTVATEDFGSITNVMCRMMYPQDTFKINVKQFTRLMPLVAPSYGKIDNITRGFTVPVEFVWPHFNKFLQNEISVEGNAYHMPTFSAAMLLNRLLGRNDDTVAYEGKNFWYDAARSASTGFVFWKNFLRPIDLAKFEVRETSFSDGDSEVKGITYDVSSLFEQVSVSKDNRNITIPSVSFHVPAIYEGYSEIYSPEGVDDDEKYKYALFEVNSIAYGPSLSGSSFEDYRNWQSFRDWYNRFHENNDYVINFDPLYYEGNEEFQSFESSITVEGGVIRNFASAFSGLSCQTLFNRTGIELMTIKSDGVPIDGSVALYGIGLKLTRYGRLFFKRLHSLGYNFDLPYSNGWNFKVNAASGTSSRQPMSFLPLACQAKYYMDWIVPARWLKTLGYLKVNDIFETNWFNQDIYPSQLLTYNNVQSHPELMSLFDAYMFASSWFTDDYFMGCLPYPYVDPNIYPALGGIVDDNIYEPGGIKGTGFFGTSADIMSPIRGESGSPTSDDNSLSIIGLQTLGALTAMFNRGLLNGTKLQDWFVSEFGIRPSLDELHISHYWSSSQNDIFIGDVFAQASSAEGPDGSKGNYLGEYAGHGVINTFDKGADSYSCTISNAKHHQFVFITNEILPRPFYFNGLRPEVSETGVFDLYTPNWDGIGMQAIPLFELINTVGGASANQLDYIDNFRQHFDETFGFLPRYANWKVAFDNLLGDFRCNSLNTGLESWYINRKFDHIFINEDNTLEMISPNYMLAVEGLPNNSSDRIFQYTDNDHFYSIYQISCAASRAMIPIANGVRFTESDGSVQSATDGSVE